MLGYKFKWINILKVLSIPAILALALVISPVLEGSIEDQVEMGAEGENDSLTDQITVRFLNEPRAERLTRIKVTSDSEPIEGSQIRINNRVVGTTDEEGMRIFEVPSQSFQIEVAYQNTSTTRTVTPVGLRASNDTNDTSLDDVSNENTSEDDQGNQTSDDQENQSGDAQEDQSDDNQDESENTGTDTEDEDQSFSGIRFLNELDAGSTNRIEVLENGNPLSGRQVTLNGEILGDTNSLGQIQFTVPEKRTITVEVEGLDTREFQVNGVSSGSVSLNSPTDGESYTIGPGESQDVEFSFNKPENTSYRLYLNEEIYSQGDQASASIQISESLEPGSYTWFVRSDGQESASRSFEIIREGTSINLISQATQVDGYILQMAFEIQGEASSYDLYVNNNLEKEAPVDSTNIFTREFENAGTKNVRIEAFGSGEVQETLERSFETSAPPEATIDWLNPTGQVDTTTPQIDYEIDAGTNYEYELYLDSEFVDLGEDSGANTHSFTPDPLPQGTHSYEVKVFDDNQRNIGNTTGTFETTAERRLLQGDFSYRYSSTAGEHQIVMDMKAYEDLQYTITVNGTERVSREFTGSTTTRAEDIGSLETGQSYTAEINFESLETSKTRQETVEFTAE